MRKKILTSVVPFIVCCFFSAFVSAGGVNSNDTETVLDISLSELLDIDVVTVSKQVEKADEAPAIVDVITQQQLQNSGATNLYEALSFLPGIELMETFYGRTVLNFRGIMNMHYNNKVLMMINGNPMYEPVNALTC